MRYWVQFIYSCQITLWGNPTGSPGAFTRYAWAAVPAGWIEGPSADATAKLDDVARRIFQFECSEHEHYLLANDCYDGAGRICLSLEHIVVGPVEDELIPWVPPANGNIRSVNGENCYEVSMNGKFSFVEKTNRR